MSHEHTHGQTHHDLLGELALQLQPVLESSEQGIYLYFDDNHKLCNENFASLLGYGSAEEWAQMGGSFPALFVDASSQDTLIDAYQKAMQSMTASTISVRWQKKSGGTADTTVILVPISYEGHLFALHFIA
ncbi:MAG: PAS domain-containing protein [Candidatus Peregrinibacteria bacterium]|nr:PAS domain-containing protein [Candidatus Peregrinibacteria bacterium]